MIRYLDGEPWSIQDSSYPMDIAQQAGLLVPHDLPRGTVRAMAEHGHVEVGYRDEMITPHATSDEARTLDLGAGMPILAYVRTCYTKERPVRLTETIFAGAVVSRGTSRWRRPRWASNSIRGQVGESWRHQTDVPVQPAEPGGLPSWVMASLGLLAAILALAGGLAVLAARRAGRRARVGHAARLRCF